MKTVGAFTLEGGALSGPAEYMREQGDALVAKCLAGESVVFNVGLTRSPDAETALLVTLQTDYAGYLGMKRFNAARKGG